MKVLARGIGVLSVIFLACGLQARGGGVELANQSNYSTSWSGFDSDFTPYWEGETTVIETTPEIALALDDLFGCCCEDLTILSGYWVPVSYREQRWTVNKIRSSTQVQTHANAEYCLAGESFTASAGESVCKSSYSSAELANYAEIVTDDGRLLSNASAIAYQQSSLGDHSFVANGCVSASTILKTGVASAESNAWGTSCFEVAYSLEKDTPFSLSVDMAKLCDVDLSFSAIDNNTGELLWNLTPAESGTQWHWEWNGTLEAGEYTFSLEALTASLIDENGLQDFGGQAEFDVSLDFEAESYWVTHYPERLVSGQADDPGDQNMVALTTTTAASVAPVPEPGMLALLIAGFICYGLRSIKSRK